MITLTLEKAFILHMRPYRESSVLVDVFTEHHGRVSLVARGVRGNKKSYMQPFVFSAITAKGRGGGLLSMQQIDFIEAIVLEKKALLCGLYINELLYKILSPFDPCGNVFSAYKETLISLSNNILSLALRRFEKRVLEYLGYGLPLSIHNIQADQYYKFDPKIGPTHVTSMPDNSGTWIAGHILQAIHEENFTPEVLLPAKKILQSALATHFKYKTLVTKTFF